MWTHQYVGGRVRVCIVHRGREEAGKKSRGGIGEVGGTWKEGKGEVKFGELEHIEDGLVSFPGPPGTGRILVVWQNPQSVV